TNLSLTMNRRDQTAPTGPRRPQGVRYTAIYDRILIPTESAPTDGRRGSGTTCNLRPPVAWHLVIAVDLAAVVGRPFELRTAIVVRRAFQLFLVQIDHVAALLLVVLQGRPRQRMVLFAHAEKTAERHHRIDRATADLVDHDVINVAELVPRLIIDIGALHLIGRDEGSGGNRSGFGHS